MKILRIRLEYKVRLQISEDCFEIHIKVAYSSNPNLIKNVELSKIPIC